jgi:MoaA/NifB/PqqE/SkfB family radical SAM enzyme
MISLNDNDVIRIELELTSTCNLNCPLCYRSIKPELISNTKYRTFNAIINSIEKFSNLKYVTLAGPTSEPTLHPDFFKILSYLIKNNYEISLFLNGNTHNDFFYRKLGILFSNAKGNIYFTICGSTQEIHEKYRINSNLTQVLNRLDIINKITDKVILTWIIFNYNQNDYYENRHLFDKYELEVFNTLPVAEHFNLDSDIHLIDSLHDSYLKNICRDNSNISCPSLNYKFKLIDCDGNTFPCSLYKLYGDSHCFECSEKNYDFLRRNKIYKLAEAESDISEKDLKYDSN